MMASLWGDARAGGQAWRVYQRGLEKWLADLLQPVFDNLVAEGAVPSFVQRLRILEFTLVSPPLPVPSPDALTLPHAKPLLACGAIRRFPLWRVFLNPPPPRLKLSVRSCYCAPLIKVALRAPLAGDTPRLKHPRGSYVDLTLS